MSKFKLDRTWITAFCVFGIAFWLGMVSYLREIAQWKVKMSYLIINPNPRTDVATAIVSNLEFFRIFVLYSAILLGLVPILIGKAHRLWLGMLILSILLVPSIWYGMQITYLSMKLIDWSALAMR